MDTEEELEFFNYNSIEDMIYLCVGKKEVTWKDIFIFVFSNTDRQPSLVLSLKILLVSCVIFY